MVGSVGMKYERKEEEEAVGEVRVASCGGPTWLIGLGGVTVSPLLTSVSCILLMSASSRPWLTSSGDVATLLGIDKDLGTNGRVGVCCEGMTDEV